MLHKTLGHKALELGNNTSFSISCRQLGHHIIYCKKRDNCSVILVVDSGKDSVTILLINTHCQMDHASKNKRLAEVQDFKTVLADT